MIDDNDGAQRKAAVLARQNSVWPAPATRQPSRPGAGRVLAIVRGLVGVLALAVVPPVLLVLVFGPPGGLVPSWEAVTAFLSDQQRQNTRGILAAAIAAALWLLWALMMILLAGSLLTVVAGWRVPRLRLPAPLHRMLFGLAGTAVVALVTTPHGGGPSGTTTNLPAAAAPQMRDPGGSVLQQGTVTVLVGDARFEYEVKRGDTLSKIARKWLGDANRWPEICRLNRHQHQADGTKLTDCDLIYPGWNLRLPGDAKPPTRLKPATPQRPPKTSVPTPSATKVPTPQASTTTGPPTSPNAMSPTVPSRPATVPAAPSSAATTPSPPESSSPAAVHPDVPVTSDEHGVQISAGNWVPWAFATAIAAAAIRVWLQRRRRYTGDPDDEPLTELPAQVVAVRRAVAHHTASPKPDPDESTSPDPAPVTTPLPPGSTGLVGDGAPSAARAALAAALASGDPHQPDSHAEIIIDAGTFHTLFGTDWRTLQPWPRLQVTDTFDAALTALEARLLHRNRLLNEHDVNSLDALRLAVPDEEPLPPITLITAAPAGVDSTRTRATLTLGETLRASAVLLGEWPHGATIDVAAGGDIEMVSGATPSASRLPVLDATTALQILTTLHEAQTGTPAPPAVPTVATTMVPLHASRTTPDPTPSVPPTPTSKAPTTADRARLRVLGPPRIEGITAEGRPLRAKALELAVYLATHPGGATTREIGEYLYPDARLSQADQRVHTIASNLRHVLGRTDPTTATTSHLIKHTGRYRLNPDTVDVDVWHLRDLLRDATAATGSRRQDLLTEACALYTAPLADSMDYDWLPPHRETVRRWSTEAHLALADDFLDNNEPRAASEVLEKAIRQDRYNETLYVKAMHAHHALDDPDGIKTLLRALTKALLNLDAEPSEETITLAGQLRNSLNHR
ncbi:BTAD domain-containing putative transcriptional regulator [Actinoplanes sp. NPDC049802]|uniref:BTAD domain-containing putative transcriptional regulator n=1 Tax=Actinoplanes sp. NPDC049802 TaxID=3154742 RepID=UPI0033E99CA4